MKQYEKTDMNGINKFWINSIYDFIVLTGVIVVVLFPQISVAASGESCSWLYQESTYTRLVDKLRTRGKPVKKSFFRNDGQKNFEQTTFFRGHNKKGQIEFSKSELDNWGSYFNTVAHGASPQGDLRWFAALVGPKLAQNFQFEFKSKNGKVYIKAPNANLLKTIVERLNEQLIKNGHDPIVFLPSKADYLTPEQLLELSVSADGNFLAFFPFEDSHHHLTLHEVAWHLGAMMYPKKFHQKSRSIDMETLNMVRMIRGSALPHKESIVQKLIYERAWELDTGNAQLAVNVAAARMNLGMKSYKKMKKQIFEEELLPMKLPLSAIDVLARPEFSPKEAVVRRLIHILDIDRLFNEFPEMQKDFKVSKDFDYGEEVRVSDSTKKKYAAWIKKYMTTTEYQAEKTEVIETPSDWLIEMLANLDKRIDELNLAFKAIKSDR